MLLFSQILDENMSQTRDYLENNNNGKANNTRKYRIKHRRYVTDIEKIKEVLHQNDTCLKNYSIRIR